ncbi:MAG TPA: DUF4184 family protein [Myxococcota bacterium]|nr:DUF4184 family protein [Myxococcota bacterium]
MPFTLAHPAAAIPLRRILGSYAVPSALVIGTVTPDLPYFLMLPISRAASHSPGALFWFCVPMGFVVYVVFHAFLKRPLVSLLPSYLRRRVAPLADPPGRIPTTPWAGILVSLLAGATTHLLWDAFTHSGVPAVRGLGVLVRPLFPTRGPHAFGENALQLLSSALGFLLLAVFSLRWLRSAAPSSSDFALRTSPRVRTGLFSLFVLAWAFLALVSATPLLRYGLTPRALEDFLARALVLGSSASALLLVLFGLFWNLIQADRRFRVSRSAVEER